MSKNTLTDEVEMTEEEIMKDNYSLSKVPRERRNMSWLSITNITFGIATAIFFFQMGSFMAINFGTINAILSSIYAVIVGGTIGTIIAYLSQKTGMNVNLLSRGGGFGYIGASLTSFIYATNFIMYCAFEGIIMVHAVHEYFSFIPMWLLIVVFGIVVIPLNWFGIKQLDKLQKWSLPLFGVFVAAAIIVVLNTPALYEGSFLSYMPEGYVVGGTGLLLAIGMQNGLIGLMSLLVSDYARFLKKEDGKFGIFVIGILPQIVQFGIMGLLGIWFGLTMLEENPGVYMVQLLGFGGVLLTIITQIRINITNLYSGSLSLSNFFENIFKFKPGRNFWVVVAGIASIILMLANILDYLDSALTFQGVFLMAWAATLIADALIVKRVLKIGPGYYEYRQSKLFRWNPVGIISLLIASGLGTIAAFGFMGTFLEHTAAFFSAVVAFFVTIIVAVITKGRHYVKEEADDIPKDEYLA